MTPDFAMNNIAYILHPNSKLRRNRGIRESGLAQSPYLTHLLDGQPAAKSRVQRLFSSRGPSYVSRFIVSIVSNTVDRVFRGRTLTHLVEELKERFKSELDAATAIVLISLRVGIRASPLHIVKDCKLGLPFAVGVESVLLWSFPGFASQAAAAADMAVPQIVGKNRGPIRSPMAREFQANPTHRMPSTEGTTEMVPGLSKKPAPMESPNSSPATVDTGRKSYDDQKRD